MTDEQMQKLCNDICEGVQDYFENYDWDKAFQRYCEENW